MKDWYVSQNTSLVIYSEESYVNSQVLMRLLDEHGEQREGIGSWKCQMTSGFGCLLLLLHTSTVIALGASQSHLLVRTPCIPPT